MSPGAPAAVFVSPSSPGSPCSFSASEWAAPPCPDPEVAQLPVPDLSLRPSPSAPSRPLFLVPTGPLCSTPPVARLVPSLLSQVPVGNIVPYVPLLIRHTYSPPILIGPLQHLVSSKVVHTLCPLCYVRGPFGPLSRVHKSHMQPKNTCRYVPYLASSLLTPLTHCSRTSLLTYGTSPLATGREHTPPGPFLRATWPVPLPL